MTNIFIKTLLPFITDDKIESAVAYFNEILESYPLDEDEIENIFTISFKNKTPYISIFGISYDKEKQHFYFGKPKYQKKVIEFIKEFKKYAE